MAAAGKHFTLEEVSHAKDYIINVYDNKLVRV